MPHKTRSGRVSKQWKNLERLVAKAFKGRRISRGDDFSRKDVDVVVDDLPELRIDCKYRTRHAHHTFMKELVAKYVTTLGHEPVLVTKHHHQESAFVTVRLEFFSFLLECLRLAGKEQ